MNDAPVEQPQSTEPAVSTEAPASQEQTLDDVYKSYQIEDQPAQTQQYVPQNQPTPQQRQPEIPHIPDPALDPDGFRRYEAGRAADTHVLRNAVLQIAGQLNQQQAVAVKAKEEADIAKAVGFLEEKVPGADKEMLEVYLGHKARKDPRLLQVWNNRDKNPKAWDAALKAIGNEAAGKFEIRADSQLTENVRAMKTSQQSMATAQKGPTREEAMGQLNGSDFDREWERIKSG